MKKSFLNLLKRAFLLMGVVSLVTLYSCDKDSEETVKDPIASFQFAVSTSNYLEVTFTNYSQNATSYSWNFGDQQTSTDESPVHVYDAAGDYDVVLTATNSAGKSATYTQSITITDPNVALTILTGGSSKVWKLYREGSSMGIGPDAAGAGSWWSLANDGKRPCLYKQTFTFNHDGTFVFDDKGMIWGEGDVFKTTAFNEICFPAEAANMVNFDGVDVSAWLGGTHNFDYNPTLGTITVTGEGAYLGITKCGTSDYVSVPQNSITYDIDVEEFTGYDLMTVSVTYPDPIGHYWHFVYVSYSDASLEPDVVEESAPFGEDLPDITPTELSHTFASKDGGVLLDTIPSASKIEYGVADPAGGATLVGKFIRTTESYQELQFQTYPTKSDINFANLTTVSLDVYIPSDNDYSSTLTKAVIIGVADKSATEQWWTDNREWVNDGTAIATDTWVTLTYNLDAPTAGGGTYTPFDRNDLDMIYINIGGGGHSVPGTFYIKNLKFE
ncbi:MAG: hypothetical protein CVU09_13685 [Bacteroidetes bacterium HGW-Bacteroidetes-4]|jgi:PKD repeat protein|nr:MAG: hypothetical protein CVU09_13685 [Bacteroidetes bacterium HGW-Bacteroidetes-4]